MDDTPTTDPKRTIQRLEKQLREERKRRARAEEDLHRTKARFRDQLDSLTVGYYRTTENGHFLYANPALADMLGYSSSAQLIESVTDIAAQIYVNPAERPAAIAQAKNFPHEHPAMNHEWRKRDGASIWVQAVPRIARDDQGTALYVEGCAIDVTERMKREAEAREQHAFNQTLINAIPAPVYYKDADGIYLGCNEAYADFHGRSRAQIIGRTLADILGPERSAPILRDDEKVLAGEPPQAYASTMKDDNGETRHILVNKAPLFTASGAVMGLVGVVMDVTAQQRVEAERRKLLRAIEQTPISIVITDPGGRIEYVNPYFCQLTGYTEDEALGKTPALLKSGSHDAFFYKQLWKTISSGREWRGEFVNRKKNGDLYWEQSVISPLFDDKGRIINYIAAKEDIGQRKRAEEELQRSEKRYRQVVEGTDNVILRLDLDGRILYANRAALALLGAAAADGVLLENLVMEEDRELTRLSLRPQSFASNDGCFENRVRDARGEVRTLCWTCRLQHDEEEGTREINAMARDLTEERKLEKLKEDVERITRHDLKSPLMGILAVPQLLQSAPNITADQRDLLLAMESSAYRMLSLVNLSLDLLKMEMGTYRTNPVPVDFLSVARKVALDVSRGNKRITSRLRLLVDGSAPANNEAFLVLGEELLCYSSLSNLVLNALEGSPRDAKVSISMTREGSSARIDVHNPGTIPQAIRERFFDKYVTAGKRGGTGLGTYSARLITEAQQGTISMCTDERQGTTVTMLLPLP